MIRKLSILAIAAVSLLITSCSGSPAETGTVHGNVKIGPLVPVERPGVTYEVPCEVYEARKILIYEENGKDLVKEVAIDCDGNYQAELAPGTYIVDINHIGIDSSSDVPTEIEIQSTKMVRLDIDIDTGIR